MAQTIGRYEIRRELGRGAQSVVYLGWDPQLQREVAIKTMHFDLPDPQLNAMLLAESRTVGKLQHPNVVGIFDAGEQGGDPYLIFEYVAGKTLAERLRQDGPIEPTEATDLMRQILGALNQAHALGIIHRDLKPSNIIIDAAGRPRVMDFGIAIRTTDSPEGEEGLLGTPAYMAPEYLEDRSVSEQMDVFAAGLILLEMITARPVMEGNSAGEIVHRILNEDVKLPRGVDERLGDIILKACARRREIRFADAGQMRGAIEAYLGGGSSADDGAARQQGTLEFLLRRMRHKSDFPALSDSVSAINKLTNSDKESINKLSNTILKDFALTNKILRLVNSAYYRQAGGGGISTVSRAVIVLGFDAIRNIAITVLLFEHLQDKGNAKDLKEGFLRANLAGLMARDASVRFLARDTEEAFICSMFHDLGRLLSQYYFPEEVETIRIVMQQKQMSEAQASAQVLGISFEELGIAIARSWGFPETIVASMRKLGDGPVRKPVTHEETLRVISGFANELCEMIAGSVPGDRPRLMKTISERFSASMQLSDRGVQSVVEKSFDELTEVAGILHVNLKQSPFARQVQAFKGTIEVAAPEDDNNGLAGTLAKTVLMDAMAMTSPSVTGEEGEDEKAFQTDVESVLTAGIQDISNSLVEDMPLNDILRIILETMYRAMGFKRVLLCLKDVRGGLMVGRFGFGPDTAEIAKKFKFPLTYTPDVFHLSISKSVDILISDIDDPKIADKIPRWFRERVPAKTFVLFPLVIKGNPVALIYCDRDQAGSITIPERELQLLKTLRNQAMLAIKQSS
ncbi:protein kinase domain-containing protein [Denitratisoma oestradiolicum]|uniref:Serine/threonine protein kinase n=1 Tax=Denitratisoma oestradiolicum TaxID=311182 RepID=A0A6S6YKD8_9PROT|nr:HDOD domain-containing protein [Denitratisoma oestradiolicum]TWO78972.1 serine/threonine protein kinase [Denitratisoma oestradiolicum]CAB1368214.1 Serine/threonine protein kinase [Denitratisoma oestradiolicum]